MSASTQSRALELLLEGAPDRVRTSRYMDRFRAESPEVFERIADSPVTLRYLVTTFAYSNFLAEDVLKNPEWLIDVAQSKDLHRVLTEEEYIERLLLFLGSGEEMPAALSLAKFRRRQILRIMLRDVLGMGSLSDVTEELSNLSDAILEVAYRAIRRDLERRHGAPSCGMAVIAVGKLGARELNYSSDIDLIFVYGANGETSGREPVSYKEFYKKVANQYTDLLSTYTSEGMCYRVDLRLRPDGTLGEVCISLDGAKDYYKARARDWELQMLIKGRVAAGDRAVGRELLDYVEPMIYRTTLDFRAVEAVSEARQRIGEKVATKRRRSAEIDVKLSLGGIRDVEFLVQCLQRLHGGREPWLRHAGTLMALFRLRDKGLLSGNEYSRLASAYQFLRQVEHRLQFLDDLQTHTLPAGQKELEALARRAPHEASRDRYTAATLVSEIERHQAEVRELYERVIHAQRPIYYSPAWTPESAAPEPAGDDAAWPSNLARFLDVKAPDLAATLARSPIPRGQERLEHFLEKLTAEPQWLARFEASPKLIGRALDLFAHSQFFADHLLRNPAHLFQLERETPPEKIGDPIELRRWFWLEMLRVQARSVHERVPIFNTLEATSDLADRVIAESYRMAIEQKDPGRPPRMTVIALGRLGMREFDLASDADLVFVIPDSETGPAQLFWTQAAERIIDISSAYTGDGVMFSVDTRLRPNGREGALVQHAAAVKDYFATRAEAWEGISYMKARAIAGDIEWGTAFLNELQEVDWRRYGQSGRSKPELVAMRQRLEKEQAVRNPLKAGRGGYYDIDFVLMYLRLKGAGIFFKHLNTPQRIDVVEKMGHLDREDAAFLQDAAAFYRAIDHGMRVWSGQAGGKLPTAAAQIEVLTDLVRRWTPAVLGEQRIGAKLQEIRARTRELFTRVFR